MHDLRIPAAGTDTTTLIDGADGSASAVPATADGADVQGYQYIGQFPGWSMSWEGRGIPLRWVPLPSHVVVARNNGFVNYYPGLR